MTNVSDVLASHGFHPDLSPDSRQAFLRACKDGPTEVVKAYLELGMPLDVRVDISRETVLIKAAEGGSIERLALLIDHGADLEGRDSSGDTALRTALNWGHPEAARYLASRGADCTAEGPYGVSALEHAMEEHPDHVPLLLELGADPNFVSLPFDRSPLRRAIEQGDPETLRMLLERGADPNRVLDRQGARPLCYAVRSDQTEMVELLLERGADPRATDRFGGTPVDAALEAPYADHLVEALMNEVNGEVTEAELARAAVWHAIGDGDVARAIEAIRSARLSIDVRDREGRTPLMRAVANGDLEGSRALLDAGADPCLEDPRGGTALNLVTGESKAAMVELLIARGARGTNAKGETQGLHSAVWEQELDVVRAILSVAQDVAEGEWERLVSAAVMKQNVELVRALHEAGAPLGLHSEIGGEVPLHGAATHYRSEEMLRYLLAHGADPNAASLGATPLHRAVEHYAYDEMFLEVLRILLEGGARLDALDDYTRTPFECARAESRAHLVRLVVEEPAATLDREALVARQSWATLPIWYAAGRVDDVRAFIEAGVAFEPPPEVRSSPLLQKAIEAHDLGTVAFLIERGADVHRRGHYGTPLVATAAATGDPQLVALLLDAGADPNAMDDFHSTPAHFAVRHYPVLELLAARGARIGEGEVSTALLATVRHGPVESVRLLLAHGASTETTEEQGHTPLSAAIERGDASIVEALLEAGAEVHRVPRATGAPPIVSAAKKGHVEIVRALLARGADPTAKDAEGEDALSAFARRKELRAAFVDVLAKHGIDASPPPPPEPLPEALRSPSPFFRAIYTGDVVALKACLDAGQPVDERDPWGMTGLMHAVSADRSELVELLIAHGADVRAKDHAGTSVTGHLSLGSHGGLVDGLLEQAAGESLLSMDVLNERAARSMEADAVRDLLGRGELRKVVERVRSGALNPYTTVGGNSLINVAIGLGDPDLIDYLLALGLEPCADLRGVHPLLTALQQHDFALAERLVQAGVSVDAIVSGAPLILSCLQRYDEGGARWLLEHGAAVDARDALGRSALHLAAMNGLAQVAVELIARGFPVDARDDEGGTPLHRAIQNWWGAREVAERLIEAGAQVGGFDARGWSPLHLAVDHYLEDAARFLLEHGASWDAASEGGTSARALAEELGLDPATWPASYDPVDA